MRKIKKSVWLPILLLIYFFVMTYMYAPELIRTGQVTRLVTVAIIELAVLVTLHFFLKKREQIK